MMKDPGSPKMGVWLLVGLGLTHRDLIGPFYESICAQNKNPTTQIHTHTHTHTYLLVEWITKEWKIK